MTARGEHETLKAAVERLTREVGKLGDTEAIRRVQFAYGYFMDKGLYQEVVDGMNQDLAQYERIKKIRLLPREFSGQSGELTPTLKVKRKVVEQNWRDEIEQIYAE